MIINRTNYETYFLRYIDEDLSEAEQRMVDNFVAENTDLAIELVYLSNTKLVPDETIVFSNKELLYKKEKTASPILFLTWQKIAVAAAFIGLVFLTWKLLPTKESVQPMVINSGINKNPSALMPTKKPIPSNSNNKQTSNHYAVQFKKPATNNMSTQTTTLSIAVLNNETPIKENNTSLVVTNNENTTPNKTLHSAATDAIALQDPNEKTVGSNKTLESTEQINKAVTNNTNVSSTLMHRTVYKELDTETDNNSLYVGSIELNKDRLRGLFRKATNLLKRKSDQPTDKTYIAQNNPSFN